MPRVEIRARGEARSRNYKLRRSATGLAFIAPSYAGFLLFILGPTLAVVVLSFTSYDLFTSPSWAGFRNYTALFNDTRFYTVLRNTAFFSVASTLLTVGLGLGLALLLNQHMPKWLRNTFRSAFFFPTFVAMVYVTLIWQYLYQRDVGAINYYLGLIGLGPVDWLSSPRVALWSIVLLDVWKNVGFAMLICLAGLQNIPRDYYDAARLDGAGAWKLLRHITVPSLSPTLFFLVVVNMISAIQIFDAPVVLTRGGPGDSTTTLVMYIYEQGFRSLQFGYASTVAVALLVMTIALTAVQFRLSRNWVHYE